MKTYLKHHGIKGQQWGVRRYQNGDGTLTEEGKAKYMFDSEEKYNIETGKNTKLTSQIIGTISGLSAGALIGISVLRNKDWITDGQRTIDSFTGMSYKSCLNKIALSTIGLGVIGAILGNTVGTRINKTNNAYKDLKKAQTVKESNEKVYVLE